MWTVTEMETNFVNISTLIYYKHLYVSNIFVFFPFISSASNIKCNNNRYFYNMYFCLRILKSNYHPRHRIFFRRKK
jgi:hypothetical protein